MHLSTELFEAVRRGDLEPRRFAEILIDHLVELCDHCRAEVEADDRERRGVLEPALVAFGKLVEQSTPRLLEEEERARRDLRELLALPRGERYGRVQRARTHFRGILFARLALEEARASLPARPERALDFAKIAQAAVFLRPDSKPAVAVFALATAHVGNAHRVLGELEPASRMFELTRRVLLVHGVTDLGAHAEIDLLEAGLREDERQLARAQGLLDTATTLYRLLKDRRGLAETLVCRGRVSRHQGNLEEAVRSVTEALLHLQPEQDPRLYLGARQDLALFQCELGRFEAARDLLEADLALCEKLDDERTEARLFWLLGKVCRGMGSFADGESALAAAREAFLGQRNGCEAVLVSLDLALLYLDGGRTGELERLAGGLAETFGARGLHQEGVRALLLLGEAARRKTLTTELLEELSVYFEAAWHHPQLRFTRPRGCRGG